MIRRQGVLENKINIYDDWTSYDSKTKCLRKQIHIYLMLGFLIKLQISRELNQEIVSR